MLVYVQAYFEHIQTSVSLFQVPAITITGKLHLNVMPYLVHVVSVIPEPLVDSGDATLAARVIIMDKLRAVLVDGIVGQMHTLLTLWGERKREGGRKREGERERRDGGWGEREFSFG